MRRGDILNALHNSGDSRLNVQGDSPSLNDPRHSNAYSPLWDAGGHVDSSAIAHHRNNTPSTNRTRTRSWSLRCKGLITGLMVAPYGSAGSPLTVPAGLHEPARPTADLAPNPLPN